LLRWLRSLDLMAMFAAKPPIASGRMHSSADPLVEVTPTPRLARLEAAHHWMQCLAEVP